MGLIHISFIAMVFLILNPGYSSPIMVKFGTKEGPIVPASSTTTTTPAPAYTHRPAPVYETPDDIPNPRVYKPLAPKQYRKQIYKYKPNPNLILGTPLDQKYIAGLYKNTDYYQKNPRSLGSDYRGPQYFGYQEYEKEYEKNNYYNKIDSRQDEFNFRNHPRDQENTATRTVPQIGIVYSSGVRYYVPQLMYYDDIDNSVYQANDLKYYYHNRPQHHSQDENQHQNNYY